MTRDERLEELSASRKNLIQVMETQAATLADLRAKLTESEGNVAYWKTYSGEIAEALQRGEGT